MNEKKAMFLDFSLRFIRTFPLYQREKSTLKELDDFIDKFIEEYFPHVKENTRLDISEE